MQNSFYTRFGKTIFDMVASFLGLILLLPILLIVSIFVKLTSKGSVFFIQKRVGKDFKEFNLYKFRSMKDEEGLSITSKDDPRITKIGAIIRKLKVDELPQLLNVIKGDMSLVGPRPEVIKHVKSKEIEYKKILKIKPGITDLAAIEYRDEEEILATYEDKERAYTQEILPKKIALYNKYIDNITFISDIKIILKTLKVI